nr:AIM24 family protein [Ardenticatenia bacterium]
MQIEILYRPSYSLAMVTLSPNESIQVEGGAMVSMSPDIKMYTEATGGFLKSLTR